MDEDTTDQDAVELTQALATLKKHGISIEKTFKQALDPSSPKGPKTVKEREIPKGWSSQSVAVYYNEREAMLVKGVFDYMIEHNVKAYLLPASRFNRKKATVYSAICQGAMYLADKLDTEDQKYRKFREGLEIINRDPRGIILQRRVAKYDMQSKIKLTPDGGTILDNIGGEDISTETLEKAEKEQREVTVGWRTKLDDFLQTAQDGDKLEEHFMLTAEDQLDLAISLQGLHGVYYSYNKNTGRLLVRKVLGEVPAEVRYMSNQGEINKQ